jgi:hypothetical protein
MKAHKLIPFAAIVAVALLITSVKAEAQSFIQANFNHFPGPGNTIAYTTSEPNFVSTPGNTVVVYSRCSGSATNVFTVSDSFNTAGWQGPFYNNDGNNNERSAMFYIQPTSSISTPYVTFGTSCSDASIIALELSDISVSGLDSSPVFTNHSTAVTSGTTAALTTSNANDILISCTDAASADETTYTAGTGYTLPPVTKTARAVCQYKIVSATQSAVHAGVGWNAATSYDSVFFAFKGSGSGSQSQTVDYQEGCNGSRSGTGTCGFWQVADGGTNGIAPWTLAPSYDPGAGFPFTATISPTTAFQDDYFFVKMGAPDTTAHFTYCTSWQIPNSADLSKFQAVETDFHHNTIDGHAYTGGVQFLSSIGGGPAVRLFDLGTNTWHAVSGLTMPLVDTNWHTLCYSFTNDHTNHNTSYSSITIDGSTTPLSNTYNGKTTTALPVLGVAVQLDGDSADDSYTLQVKNWSVSFSN